MVYVIDKERKWVEWPEKWGSNLACAFATEIHSHQSASCPLPSLTLCPWNAPSLCQPTCPAAAHGPHNRSTDVVLVAAPTGSMVVPTMAG